MIFKIRSREGEVKVRSARSVVRVCEEKPSRMNCGTWLATVTLLFVLVLERIACGIFSQEPGFRVLLTKKGLEYGI